MRARRWLATTTTVALVALGAAASANGHSSLTSFQSPTKNIGCTVDSHGARCDIRARTWSPPARPRSCRLDYGQGLAIRTSGAGRFVCAGDTALGSGRTLAYGHAVRRGRFTCTSRSSGVRCVNRRDHHGFSLSRSGYHRF